MEDTYPQGVLLFEASSSKVLGFLTRTVVMPCLQLKSDSRKGGGEDSHGWGLGQPTKSACHTCSKLHLLPRYLPPGILGSPTSSSVNRYPQIVPGYCHLVRYTSSFLFLSRFTTGSDCLDMFYSCTYISFFLSRECKTPGSCGAGMYSMVNEMHLLRSNRFLGETSRGRQAIAFKESVHGIKE